VFLLTEPYCILCYCSLEGQRTGHSPKLMFLKLQSRSDCNAKCCPQLTPPTSPILSCPCIQVQPGCANFDSCLSSGSYSLLFARAGQFITSIIHSGAVALLVQGVRPRPWPARVRRAGWTHIRRVELRRNRYTCPARSQMRHS